MALGIQKVARDLCVFTIHVIILKKNPLNFGSFSREYNHILQSYFGEQGRGFQILRNKTMNMMLSCSENIRPVHIEE